MNHSSVVGGLDRAEVQLTVTISPTFILDLDERIDGPSVGNTSGNNLSLKFSYSFRYRVSNISYSRYIFISFSFSTVAKSGSSPDTSHRYIPSEDKSTCFKYTDFLFDRDT